MNPQRRVFISVCEHSADLHGAALVRAAAKLFPHVGFYGLTGPRMRGAGVETLYDFTAHSAMLSGVLSVIGHARRALRLIEESWRREPPDLVVLLDSPELHLRLARRARRLGLKVLYYIAPQTWAARAYRNRQIARAVDALACILPFEEPYFRRVGIAAEYVGHPLWEALPAPDAAQVAELRRGADPLVALLPGSRRHVIDALLPRQLQVIQGLRQRGRALRVAVSCVEEDRKAGIEAHLRAAGDDARVVVGKHAGLLQAADLVLVASGTATLEVACYRKPMVVMYHAGGLLEWPYRLLGRRVIRLPHLCLVNILAGARVVPEFMPFVRDCGPVTEVADRLLTDAVWRDLMCRQLDAVIRPLEGSQASAAVCEIMARLLGMEASGPRTQIRAGSLDAS